MQDLFLQLLGMLLANSYQLSCLLRNHPDGAGPPHTRVPSLPEATLIQWLVDEDVNRPDSPSLPRAISEGQSQLQNTPWSWLKLLLGFISVNFSSVESCLLQRSWKQDLSEHMTICMTTFIPKPVSWQTNLFYLFVTPSFLSVIAPLFYLSLQQSSKDYLYSLPINPSVNI